MKQKIFSTQYEADTFLWHNRDKITESYKSKFKANGEWYICVEYSDK